ncbi:hypothetical protein F5051DRAFT_435081 [Lentinula edodes]|nr:hypothetical protein F5051DRAFT_435081 [Lentinula edodes]
MSRFIQLMMAITPPLQLSSSLSSAYSEASTVTLNGSLQCQTAMTDNVGVGNGKRREKDGMDVDVDDNEQLTLPSFPNLALSSSLFHLENYSHDTTTPSAHPLPPTKKQCIATAPSLVKYPTKIDRW